MKILKIVGLIIFTCASLAMADTIKRGDTVVCISADRGHIGLVERIFTDGRLAVSTKYIVHPDLSVWMYDGLLTRYPLIDCRVLHTDKSYSLNSITSGDSVKCSQISGIVNGIVGDLLLVRESYERSSNNFAARLIDSKTCQLEEEVNEITIYREDH